jgi:cell wall assembly regulator SMI1
MARAARKPRPPAGDDLTTQLERLERWLKKHRRRYHAGLRPGAGEKDLGPLAEALGGEVPADLRTWLGWHDGQGEDEPGALIESFRFLGAAEIVQALGEVAQDEPPGWGKGWAPFLDDGVGDYVCLCPGKKGAPVREVWRGREEHEEAAPSLAKWVEQFVDALEAGEYAEDPERGDMIRKAAE